MDDSRWLAPKEVAAWINVSLSTLAHWRGQRIGPRYRKAGRLVRYLAADVRTWLERDSDGAR